MPRINANRLEFEYVIDGDPSNPAVFAITGFCDQLTDWPETLIEPLVSAGYCFVRFDPRDMGLSTWFDDAGAPKLEDFQSLMAGKPTYSAPYTLQDMAHDALALIDALSLAPVHAIGFSLGGTVCQLAMLDSPSSFRSASLISATSGSTEIPPMPEEVLLTSLEATQEVPDRGRTALEKLLRLTNGTTYTLTDDEVRQKIDADYNRAYNPAGAGRQMMAVFSTKPHFERLSDVSVPTLVIQGLEDRFFAPAHGDDLAARIPGSRLVRLEGAGHNIFGPLGNLVAGHVLSHIDRY